MVYSDGFDTSVVPKMGVYKSFPQFLNNLPSDVDSTFHIVADPKSYDPTNPDYFLMYNNSKGKEKKFNDKIWAFSDGKKVYMRTEGTSMFTSTYRELTTMPYYSYFSEWYSISGMASGRGMNDPSVNTTTYNIVEMKSGGKTPLTKPNLRTILRNEDTQLYQHFLADGDSKDKLLEYLKALNKRLSNK